MPAAAPPGVGGTCSGGAPVTLGSPLRIAILGFGPRGFACLERLAIEAARKTPQVPLQVTAHDPFPHPGAAVIYDQDQPSELLLNFPVGNVDIWSQDNDRVPSDQRLTLLEWLRRHHPEWARAGAYAPRRLVGAYLRDAYGVLLDHLPASVGFRHVPSVVTRVARREDGWVVRHRDRRLDCRSVDQVVLTTGHGTWEPAPEAGGWIDALPPPGRTTIVPGVFPVEQRLFPEAVPPGSTVGVRGFALTWIDAALALTSGRGGRFDGLEGTDPGYRAGGDDVGAVIPFSRTGLPMSAKPGPALIQRSQEVDGRWRRLRANLQRAAPLSPLVIVRSLRSASAAALSDLRGWSLSRSVGHVHAALVEALGNGIPTSGATSAGPLRERIRQSLEVARGRMGPGGAWALGEAWRQAYPVLVERTSHGGLDPSFGPAFRALARAMERLAFGPPAENVARVLALTKAGVLDLRFVWRPAIGAGKEGLELRADDCVAALDVLVDGVVTPPGLIHADDLVQDLRDRGHVRLAPGTAGLEITPSGQCIATSGEPTPGLSAMGRVTEGWVLGNDTLSRSLHPHAANWARRILAPHLTGVPDEAAASSQGEPG
jgi:uncharacterized NAD(P)/FAD-binding protein YdhS